MFAPLRRLRFLSRYRINFAGRATFHVHATTVSTLLGPPLSQRHRLADGVARDHSTEFRADEFIRPTDQQTISFPPVSKLYQTQYQPHIQPPCLTTHLKRMPPSTYSTRSQRNRRTVMPQITQFIRTRERSELLHKITQARVLRCRIVRWPGL
jgi:hypothetical protein